MPQAIERSSAIANILKGHEDFVLDPDGKILSSNLEAVNITGYEEWEAIGRNFAMFYSEEDKKAGVPAQDLEKARANGKIIFSAWRVKKRNVTFWAQITITSLKDSDGFMNGFRMVLKDQTHRLISNNRVKKFRNEYLNLFNNPFIGVFKFRLRDLKFLLVNEKASLIIGKIRVARDFKAIFHLEEVFEKFIAEITLNGKINGFECQLNRDEETWARIDCQAFVEEGFVEGVITDITENKRQVTELERLNEELDNFIYHASHDLRSPLTTLMGLINLVEFDTQIELKEYCNMMRERVSYLDDLLKDMASIVFNSKAEVTNEPVDLNEVLQRIIEEFRPQQPNVDFKINAVADTSFFTDKQRLQLIVRNLVLNSVKHQNPHAGNCTIKIEVEVGSHQAYMKYKDNGKGIRGDQILQIFGMFYKPSQEVRDTGLGLYITKLAIDKLGGKIRVKSKVGEGTEFEIELPNMSKKGSAQALVVNASELPEMYPQIPVN